MTTMKRRGPVGLLVLALVFGGCGGAAPSIASNAPTPTAVAPSGSAASLSPSAEPSTAPPTAPPTEQPVVGKVTAITTQRGFINEARANRGDGIFAGGFVRTDQKGSLQFNLNQKIERCTLRTQTRVDILPSAEVLLHFAAGTAVCTTTADSGTVQLAAGSNVDIRMSDPLFMVTVEPEQTRVRVISGLVEVRSTETDIVQFLGPSNRADIFPGGGPTDPERWGTGELDGSTKKLVDKEKNLLPKIDFSMPDPAGSAVLKRIVAAGTIHVGLDERVAASRPSNDFADWFDEFQTDNWRIDQSEPVVANVNDGLDALQAGRTDVFVSLDTADGFGQIPFFDDEEGRRVWLLYDPSDEAFGDAERTLLRNTVTSGRYGNLYREFFGGEAPYGAVAELFGLD